MVRPAWVLTGVKPVSDKGDCTVWVAMFTTEAVLSPLFTTSARFKMSSTATPVGCIPTGTVAGAAVGRASRLTNDIELSPVFTTTAVAVAALIATAVAAALLANGTVAVAAVGMSDVRLETATLVAASEEAVVIIPRLRTTSEFTPARFSSGPASPTFKCRGSPVCEVPTTELPSNVVTVEGVKNPPVSVTVGVDVVVARAKVFGVRDSNAGFTAYTFRLVAADKSPDWLCTLKVNMAAAD